LTEVIYMINRNIATPQSWRWGMREGRDGRNAFQT